MHWLLQGDTKAVAELAQLVDKYEAESLALSAGVHLPDQVGVSVNQPSSFAWSHALSFSIEAFVYLLDVCDVRALTLFC